MGGEKQVAKIKLKPIKVKVSTKKVGNRIRVTTTVNGKSTSKTV